MDHRALTGRDLAAERVRRSLRQADVAAELGVSRERVRTMEGGRRPSELVVTRYLAALERLDAR